MTYISSQSLTNPLRTSVQQIQAKMAQVTTEESTGLKADLGLSLGASIGTGLSLQSEIDNLNSYTGTNSLATARLASTSNTLTSMVTSAQGLSKDLIEATGVGTTTTLQTSAQDALQSLVGGLNTTSGGQYIFGGINTDTQPISSTASTDLQTNATNAFQTYLASIPTTAAAMTGAQMQTFLNGAFSTQFSDSSWTNPTTGTSKASSTTMNTAISPSQTLNTSVSANDGSIRQVAQAYTMLSAFTGSAGLSVDALNTVTAAAGKLLSSGTNGLNNVTAAVGVAQSTMDTTNTQISSQIDVLKSNLNDLEGVDATTLPTLLAQLTTQLTASFEMTSKIGQLSLVNYLNG